MALPIPEALLLDPEQILLEASRGKETSYLDIEITCASSEEFWRAPDHCLPDSGEACLVSGLF
mgnify:CR=1 FL=1